MEVLGKRYVIVVALVVMALACRASPVALAQGRSSGSMFVLGGAIHVREGETVEGGAVCLGGEIVVDGRLRGDAVSIGGPIEVNGTVDGDVVSVGSTVSLGPNARVRGDAVSVGGAVHRAEGAIVEGEVSSGGVPYRFGVHGRVLPRMGWSFLRWPLSRLSPYGPVWLVQLIGMLFLAVLVVAIWPNHVTAVAAAIETHFGRSLLVGLVGWLVLVPGVVFLAITLLGIPLIPVWVILYVAAGILGYSAASILVGDRVARLANASMSMLGKVITGALILSLVGLVPLVGSVAAVAIALVGLGAVVDTKFGTNRPWFRRHEPAPPEKWRG